jgi:protein gp37
VLDRAGWVILGGESGNDSDAMKARPAELEWFARALGHAAEAETPAFMKQLGSDLAARLGLRHPKGADPIEWPKGLRVQAFPEARAA